MRYFIEISDGNDIDEFEVDGVTFQTNGGGVETGRGNLSATIIDARHDIFEADKEVWYSWLNASCNLEDEEGNSLDCSERLKDVTIRITDSNENDILELEFLQARLDHFSCTCSSMAEGSEQFAYHATITRSPGDGNADSEARVRYIREAA